MHMVSKYYGRGYGIKCSNGIFTAEIKRNGTYKAVSTTRSYALSAGWHLFTMSYDDRRLKLTIDWNYLAINNMGNSFDLQHTSKNLIIGAKPYGYGTYPNTEFNGQISDVRIYNEAKNDSWVYKRHDMGYFMPISWNFDDSSNPEKDSASLAGNNALSASSNAPNATTDRAGQSNKARNFSFSKFYYKTSHASIEPSYYSLSVSAWVKLEGNCSSKQSIISSTQGSGFAINCVRVAGKDTIKGWVKRDVDGKYSVAKHTLSSDEKNTWIHVILVYNKTKSQLYVNGKLVGEANDTIASAVRYNGSTLFIGAESAGSSTNPAGAYWQGSIDDVKIYEEFLTAPEVLCLFQAQR